MKTAVVYARYSCDRQNEQSIDGQLRVCEDFAKKNDIVIVDNYIDRAMSGTNDDRESFQRMLKDSDNKLWDYVLVYKLDRFSRNKYEMAIHRKHLKDNGIKIISAMENIPDGPEGTLLESLLEGMNQYYSEELSQKTKRGMNETRLKGNFIGGTANYGYIYKTGDVKLKVNEDEAEIVRRIFNEYVSGKKVADITRDLNNEGIKNKGKEFLYTTVTGVLRREIYTGIYRINGQVYDKIYPPILNKDIYALAKEKLQKNSHGNRQKDHVTFYLKGKAFCGYCGEKIYAFSTMMANGTRLRYYKCHNDAKTHNQTQTRTIQKEYLEELVKNAISKVFSTPENISLFTEKVYELHKKKISENATLNILNSDLVSINKSINNIMSAIEQGIITETTKSRLEELETKKHELQKQIMTEKSKEKAVLSKEKIENYFKYSLNQTAENMLNLLVKAVYVYNDKIEISFNYMTNSNQAETGMTIKLFSKTFTKTRNLKNGNTRKRNFHYDVYIRI